MQNLLEALAVCLNNLKYTEINLNAIIIRSFNIKFFANSDSAENSHSEKSSIASAGALKF
jgi:hypothetical protein